jgi:phenylacetic acid degradation operon negative regulatory protein
VILHHRQVILTRQINNFAVCSPLTAEFIFQKIKSDRLKKSENTMKKLLTPSHWLLLGLGRFLDIYEEIRDPFNLLENYYRSLGISPTKYTKHNFYQLIWENLKTNNIEKIIKNGEVFFELTRQGKEKITTKFPLLSLQKEPWDKKWRIAIYDIEEINKSTRESLRYKLKELGFAQLQKSVWVTPHDFLKDIHDFLETNNLLLEVILIETKNFFIEDIKELANKLWKLEELNNLYKEIYLTLNQEDVTKNGHNKKSTILKQTGDRIKNSENVKEMIIETFLTDPYLPKELLPHDWLGEKVRELVKRKKVFSEKNKRSQ